MVTCQQSCKMPATAEKLACLGQTITVKLAEKKEEPYGGRGGGGRGGDRGGGRSYGGGGYGDRGGKYHLVLR